MLRNAFNLFEFARTTENFALNTRGGLKLCRFSSPAMSSLNLLRPLRGWREGTDDISDYDLALFPLQCHFSKNTSKEFIIVFQNERGETRDYSGTSI